MVVQAQASQHALPSGPAAPYCPASATERPPDCDATPDEHAKLIVDVTRQLEEFDHAFFVACRAQRDKLATMVTTQANATDLMVSSVANRLAGAGGADRATSDLGAMPYVRARMKEALVKALADALDDQVEQHTATTIEHLDAISDRDLRWIAAEADAGHAAKLVEWGLFYVGKQSPRDQ